MNPYEPPQSEDGRPVRFWPPGPGAASIALALASVGLFVFMGSHLHADRTNRIPVVTYVGPAANWITTLAVTGHGLSLAAILCGGQAIDRGKVGRPLGTLGIFTSIVAVLGNCLFYLAAYND